jgi:hypothetical protein
LTDQNDVPHLSGLGYRQLMDEALSILEDAISEAEAEL